MVVGWVGIVAWSGLGCSGGAVETPPPAPPAVAPAPAPVPVAALAAGPAWWLEVVEGSCRWREGALPDGTAADVANLGTPACPERPSFHVAPDAARALIVPFAGKPLLVDLATRAPVALPPELEDATFAADGALFGCWSLPTEDKGDKLVADGKTYPYDAENSSWAAGKEVARVVKIGAAGVEPVGDEAVLVPEGTDTPTCHHAAAWPDAAGGEVASTRELSGGHGAMFERAEGLPAAPTTPIELEWYLVPDAGPDVAVAGLWLEGAQLEGPVALKLGGTWKVLDGTGGAIGRIGDYLRVNGPNGGVLVDPRDGSFAWRGPAAVAAPRSLAAR